VLDGRGRELLLLLENCGSHSGAKLEPAERRISYMRTTPEVWEQTIKRMIRLNGVSEQRFSRQSIDVARPTITAAASFARHVSGRQRRRYAGKAWTGSGLAKAQNAWVGKIIESRQFEEDAKWSFAK
jgi:hypothetical protein